MANALVAQQDVYPDLKGKKLLQALVSDFRPDLLIGYGPTRDSMYLNVYRNENGYIECYYSGHEVYLPIGEDPSSFIYKNGDDFGITAEHIFPQSKGASEGNARSDMHALFPAIRQVNESRSNYPFGEIPDDETDHWFSLMKDITTVPNSKLDDYSEQLNGGFGNPGKFEPRESVKGDVARAVFYFYTMYKEEADRADENFFDDMKETLIEWHYKDDVDETELLRTNLRAKFQEGKTNPYVLDCTLVDRAFGRGESDCNSLSN